MLSSIAVLIVQRVGCVAQAPHTIQSASTALVRQPCSSRLADNDKSAKQIDPSELRARLVDLGHVELEL